MIVIVATVAVPDFLYQKKIVAVINMIVLTFREC
jgi:hypothetical protein